MTDDPRAQKRAIEAEYRERHRRAYNLRKKLDMRARRKDARLERIRMAKRV